MDREKLVDEMLMLLPTLMRLVERPSPVEMGEIARRGLTDVQVSPGHCRPIRFSSARCAVSSMP